MQTKKGIIGLVAVLVAVAVAASPAVAGSEQRHRWEGVAIGLGAALLGHTIYQAHKVDRQPPVVVVEPAPSVRRYQHGHGRHHHRGHWEWQRTWVPPTYERVWNPGHYNRRGHWIAGHWIDVQTADGYWTKERIWVAHRDRW